MTTPSFTFSGISLDLAPQGNQLWLSNDQLANCLGIGKSRISNLPSRHPERFSETETRLVQTDLHLLAVDANTPKSPDLMSLPATSNTQKRKRGTGAKTTRFWSFPDGCITAALEINTDRAKQLVKWLLNHYKLKALQAGNYIYSKRPRMRMVAQAADAGGNTRAQAEAAGFRCLESARRNRKEAHAAGLLNTPALPEAVQLGLFAAPKALEQRAGDTP